MPDGSELTSYLVSFLVIAQFWMVHHRVLRGMRGHSEGLAWRNFSFLLALTLMPFTSDLIGRYGTNPVAITLFGLNLVAISLSTQWIFLYAAHHDLLMDVARSKRDERTARVRVVFVIGIVALSMVLAWTDPQLAKFVWLLFLVVSPVAERISRQLEHSDGSTRRTRGTEQGRQGLTRASHGGRLVQVGSGRLVARRVGRLLGHHVVDQIAECQVDVIQVEAPGRTERGRDDRTAVAGARRDLEPGRATRTVTRPRVETGVGDPRFPGRNGRRDEVGRQRRCAGPSESRRVRADDLLAALGLLIRLEADALAGPSEERI